MRNEIFDLDNSTQSTAYAYQPLRHGRRPLRVLILMLLASIGAISTAAATSTAVWEASGKRYAVDIIREVVKAPSIHMTKADPQIVVARNQGQRSGGPQAGKADIVDPQLVRH